MTLCVTTLLLYFACTVVANKKWIDRRVQIEVVKGVSDDQCVMARKRDTVHQFYKVKLKDGSLVDTNFDGQPFVFRLGMGEVITGMDIGMKGMCQGEERNLVIPSDLGYGERGVTAHGIPGGATLYFHIKLAKIIPSNKWTDYGIEIEVTRAIPEKQCKHAKHGDTLHQYYTLSLEDGFVVDSNEGTNTPFIFKLGNGEVIAGMDLAMTDMCEGEKRKLKIPPELAYGEKGIEGQIAPGSTLYFDIELRKIIPGGKHDEL